jgi:AraC-like DNA-binding protein
MAGDDNVPPSPLRFSTNDLPARERLAIWRELIGRTVARLDVSPLDDGLFLSKGVTHVLPGLALTQSSVAGIRSQRTRELLADGNDDIDLLFIDNGSAIATQLGREVAMDAGVAILASNADESTIITPTAKGYSLRIPRLALKPLVANLEDAFMRPLPRTSEAMQLLTGYVSALEQMPLPATRELRHLIVTHVYDLLATAIGATRDAAEVAAGRGIRAARFAAIRADIARNVARHGLSAEWIAPRHGISSSTVRRLFEEAGTTFSQFVLDYRLARAHQLLRDPRLHDRTTIRRIAFSLGFNDLSYFNRTFRRLYGATPSEVRDAATREDNG